MPFVESSTGSAMSLYLHSVSLLSIPGSLWNTGTHLIYPPTLAGIIVYEHITLFSLERKLIWRKPISAVSIISLFNRYATLVYGVLGVAGMFTLEPMVSLLYSVNKK